MSTLIRPALYYPYIHIRSEHWLKATLLCAPNVRRIVPSSYEPEDIPNIARYTKIEGLDGPLLQAVDASLDGAQSRLLEKFREHHPRILGQFNRKEAIGFEEYMIHDAKLSEELVAYLLEHDLAWPREHTAERFGNRGWYALHPLLGSAIMSTLGLSIAREHHFDIVTPSRNVHETLLATEESRVFETLLGYGADQAPTTSQARNELAQLTISLCGINLQALNPEDISELQRSKYFQEFQALIRLQAHNIERDGDASHYKAQMKLAAERIVDAWQETKTGLNKSLRAALYESGFILTQEVLRGLTGNTDQTTLLISGAMAIGLIVFRKPGDQRESEESRPYQYLTEVMEKQNEFAQLTFPLGLER
jgi:hypothetical protein